MITCGIVRKVDPLGRVVLPIELRRLLEIEEREMLELREGQKTIIIKKLTNSCAFCGNKKSLQPFKSKYVCRGCIRDIKKAD